MKLKTKKLKLCLVSSTGGHWQELMCLYGLSETYDVFFVTEQNEKLSINFSQKIFFLNQIDRKMRGAILKFFQLCIQSFKIIAKEKPDVVITTGALFSFPFCLVGKIMRKKIVYIESYARVTTKSLTGRLVYPISDLFIIQWESLLKCYPKAIYKGALF